MALNARITKLEDVAEPFRKEYVPADDGNGFVLDVTNFDALPGVMGLKSKNTELLSTTVKLKETLKKFDGVDVDDLNKQITELKKAGGSAADVAALRADYEGKIKGIQSASQAELEKAHKERDEEVGAARNFFVDALVTEALRKVGVSPKVLGHVVRERLKVERKDGRFEAQVLDNNGQPRIKNGQGHAFTVDDLVGELRNDPEFAVAFPATGAGGSGTQGSGNNSTGAGGQKVIKAEDIGANLEGVANGTVKVQR